MKPGMKPKAVNKATKNPPSKQPNVQATPLSSNITTPSVQEKHPISRVVPLTPEENQSHTQLSIPPSYPHPVNNDDVPPPPALPSASVLEQDQALLIPPEDEPKRKDPNDQIEPKELPKVGKRLFPRYCKKTVSIIKTFPTWSHVVFMIGNLIILICFARYYFPRKKLTTASAVDVYTYISSNLSQDPILDIIVQDDGNACPSGYSELLLGTWPGTVLGCFCPGLYLRAGECNRSAEPDEDWPEDSCQDVLPRGRTTMYNWGGSKWCVQRAKPGTEYTKTVSCETGFRECSPGICVLSSLSCPVTKVKIDTTGTHKLKLGTDRYVVTEKVQGESPVIDLEITPNNIPCFVQGTFASGPMPPYTLINANEHGCSKYGLDDEYSFELDREKQEQLFEQNSFHESIFDLVDYRPYYEATDYVLSYQKRMNVAKKEVCLTFDATIIKNSQNAAQDLNRYMNKSLLAGLILHSVLVFFVGLFYVDARSKVSKEEALIGEQSKAWFIPLFFLGCFELVDIAVMFAAAKNYRNQMIAGENYLVQLGEMECFSKSQVYVMIADYQAYMDVLVHPCFAYALSLLLVITLFFVPHSVRYLGRCIQKRGDLNS